MGVAALFRVRLAVQFWGKVRTAAYVYVGAIVVLAIIQLIFHVRL